MIIKHDSINVYIEKRIYLLLILYNALIDWIQKKKKTGLLGVHKCLSAHLSAKCLYYFFLILNPEKQDSLVMFLSDK